MDPSFAALPAPWLPLALGAVSVLALLASAGALAASMTDRRGRTAPLACGSTLLTALLLGASVPHWLPRWGLVLSCLGFLAGIESIAIEIGRREPLRSYLSNEPPSGDPDWWPEFESGFWRHVRRQARNRPSGPPDSTASNRR